MNLKDKVYQLVKERIMSGEYEPGQQIVEKDVIDELKVSRTPFREAMNALSKEYLVNLIPNRGFFVREYSEKDCLDIFDVRYLLEPNVMRQICGKVSQEVLRRLRSSAEAAIESGEEEKIRRDDAAFHRTLVRYLENRYLIGLLENIYENDEIRLRHDRTVRSMTEGLQEHLAILEGLESGDGEAAARAMIRHLRNGRRRAMNTIF